MSRPRPYLLDTSAYSAFKRGHRGIVEVVLSARSIVLSPVILGELHQGFLRGKRLHQNRSELADFLAASSVRTIEIDAATAEAYGEIYDRLRQQGTMIPINDVWIAATALQHDLVVLTLDRHFARIETVPAEIHTP